MERLPTIYTDTGAFWDGIAAACEPQTTTDDNPFTADWELARRWHLGFIQGREAQRKVHCGA